MPTSYFVGNNLNNVLRVDSSAVVSKFAHESMHVWQRQQDKKNVFMRALLPQILYTITGGLYDPYNYDKSINDPDKVLKMFLGANVEQQGQIMEDYVRAAENKQDTSKYSRLSEYILNRDLKEAKDKPSKDE